MKRLVLIDALGTLIELEPPWDHLAPRLDGSAPAERLEAAVRAEMAYYRAHAQEGRDPDSLRDLRRRCAGVLSAELGVEVTPATLMEAIRFRAFPDARPALEALREAGIGTVVVSNWDCSLPETLERAALRDAVDAVVTSAEAGASKPDPAIFAMALEVAGCAAEEAVHVGDTPGEDIEGAAAAGIEALLIDRDGSEGDITSLADLAGRLRP